jgi:hypothetical protein
MSDYLYHFTFNLLHIDLLTKAPANPPYQGGNKKSICSKHLVNWYYSFPTVRLSTPVFPTPHSPLPNLIWILDLLLAIARTGKMPIPLLVIFSCGVCVPPAQKCDEKECEQEVYSSSGKGLIILEAIPKQNHRYTGIHPSPTH